MAHNSEIHTQGQLRVIAAMYKTGSYKEAAELPRPLKPSFLVERHDVAHHGGFYQ